MEEYIRNNADHAAHPVGTAAMSSSKEDSDGKLGVVDPDLRVKKVRGLRVVDASVVVSGHISVVSWANQADCDWEY